MRLAHGIDLVDFQRLEKLVSEHGQRFLDRVFTAKEQSDASQIKNRIEKLAGRFAAKEAIMKLLGTGWRDGIAWTDIEVVNDPLGKPVVHLSGKVSQIATQQKLRSIAISITHTSQFAIASVVAIQEE